MTDKEIEFENFLKLIREGFEKEIPFHRLLDMKIETFNIDEVCIHIDMKKELIGNVFQEMLHGGVISAVLDITGGIMATLGVIKELKATNTIEELAERIMKISTIDLRTDYIKPGKGKYFRTKGTILRTGNVVSVTRMELYNDTGVLIAVGTGTYKCG